MRALAPGPKLYGIEKRSRTTTLMMRKENSQPLNTNSDQSWVLSSLEPDQLANAKKHPIPRRHLKGPELLILWSLRLYLLFMMAVVGYQVWIAAR
jgi:hypothetical protein